MEVVSCKDALSTASRTLRDGSVRSAPPPVWSTSRSCAQVKAVDCIARYSGLDLDLINTTMVNWLLENANYTLFYLAIASRDFVACWL